jgi:uncharacterized protein (DUF1697 family)
MSSPAVYAAFLRGMNVGGHRLTNNELCAHFEQLGFHGVATFRASGNVVFAAAGEDSGEVSDEAMQERIEQGLALALGYAVPTFIRSAEEVRAIAALAPFDAEELATSKGKLQVALLTAAPQRRAREEVLSLAGAHDRLALRAGELYWLPSGGVLDSTLDMKTIERLLGSMTMRTKGTIEQIASRHFAG